MFIRQYYHRNRYVYCIHMWAYVAYTYFDILSTVARILWSDYRYICVQCTYIYTVHECASVACYQLFMWHTLFCGFDNNDIKWIKQKSKHGSNADALHVRKHCQSEHCWCCGFTNFKTRAYRPKERERWHPPICFHVHDKSDIIIKIRAHKLTLRKLHHQQQRLRRQWHFFLVIRTHTVVCGFA